MQVLSIEEGTSDDYKRPTGLLRREENASKTDGVDAEMVNLP